MDPLDRRRLEKLRDNLAKLIGEPIVPPGFIERMRDEIRAIAAKLKECRAVSGDGAAQGAGGDAVTLKKGDLIRVDLGWEGVATFRVDTEQRVNCHPRAHYPDRPYVHATRVSRPRHSSYTLYRSFYVDEVELIRSC